LDSHTPIPDACSGFHLLRLTQLIAEGDPLGDVFDHVLELDRRAVRVMRDPPTKWSRA
jgi:hypothetical protein